MPSRVLPIVVCIIAMIAAAGCKASSVLPPSTTTPTAPDPVPGDQVVNIAGNWVGTLESANMATQTLSMVVVQFGNCVDGSWRASSGEWSGAISGFAGRNSYTGFFTFERPASGSGGSCIASATVTGEVGADTLRWTGSNVTPIGQCAGELPQSIVISMRRQ